MLLPTNKRTLKINKMSQTDGIDIGKIQSFLICAGEYYMEPSSSGAIAFANLDLFLETVS